MDRPNLLILMADQQSPHILRHAGDHLVRTPHLDRLAEEGVRFTSAYCGSPLCVPSRMTFLTARHCSDIEVWSNGCVLDSAIPTFAGALAASGYETLLCGRMHFAGPDQRHGFTRRLLGDIGQARYAPGQERSLLGEIPRETTGQTASAVRTAGAGSSSYLAYDDAVTVAAIEFLRSAEATNDPWAMVVGFLLPHCPFVCPPDLFDYYYERVTVPELPTGHLESLHPVMRASYERREFASLTNEQIRVARAAYYGLVEYHDRRCGEVLAALASAGLADRTAVVYLSDHGEMAGEHGLWTKSNFYEGSVNVPMIWRWPGEFERNAAVAAVASLLDVGPTLLEIAGARPMAGVAGRSLLPFLTASGDPDWPDETFSEYCGLVSDPPARMIRQRQWKLVHHHGCDEAQLFELSSDPGEWNDLRDCPEHTSIRDQLHVRVRRDWDGERVQAAMGEQEARRAAVIGHAAAPPEAAEDHWDLPADVNWLAPREG